MQGGGLPVDGQEGRLIPHVKPHVVARHLTPSTEPTRCKNTWSFGLNIILFRQFTYTEIHVEHIAIHGQG